MTDDELPDYLAALGVPGIVDVHVHFMPTAVQRAVWDFFDRAEQEYGAPWPITYRSSDAQRLSTLRSLGVLAFPALVYAHRPGMSAWLNDWALDFAADTPGCIPTMTFFPEEGVGEYVGAALQRGARLVKLHLQVGGYDPRDARLEPAWTQVEEAGVPLVVHCGSGPLPGPFTGVGPISEVLARHPGLRVIVAHLGAPEYEDFLDLADRHETVCLDTTMACTDFMQERMPLPASLVPRLRRLAGEGRVLFGSDFPSIPYPYSHQVESLVRIGLDDDEMRQVLWHAGTSVVGRP